MSFSSNLATNIVATHTAMNNIRNMKGGYSNDDFDDENNSDKNKSDNKKNKKSLKVIVICSVMLLIGIIVFILI